MKRISYHARPDIASLSCPRRLRIRSTCRRRSPYMTALRTERDSARISAAQRGVVAPALSLTTTAKELAMKAPKDISGMRFGRLVAERFVEFRTFGTVAAGARAVWEFRCDCGGLVTTPAQNVKARWHSGQCPDCVRQSRAARTYLHGSTGTRLHRIWIGARQRCRNSNDKRWADYGGRGIAFAPEWDDFTVFRDWSIANGYSDKLELDRIDNDGPYEAANCRWSGRRIQCRNTRRTRYVTLHGRKTTLAEISEQTGIHYNTLRWRIFRTGLTPEEAVERPSDVCATCSA